MTRTRKQSRYLGGVERLSPFPRRILLADHAGRMVGVAGELAARGHTAVGSQTTDATLSAIAERRPDLIVLAALAATASDPEVARVIGAREGDQHTPIILVTDERAEDVLRHTRGAVDDVLPASDSSAETILERLLIALARLDRIRANEERSRSLERQAITDFKTGTFNDRYFHRRLREEFNRARRYRSAISCVMLDFDNFKEINDSFDHAFGDFVLLAFARKVRAIIRDSDIPSRFGGDEFAILLPNTLLDDAVCIAERIRLIVSSYSFQRDDLATSVTLSIGISTFDGTEDISPEQFLHRADCALLEAKRQGRNRVIVHSEVIGRQAPRGIAPRFPSSDEGTLEAGAIG